MRRIKEFLNEENEKLNFKDFLTISIIVLLYGVLSFYKLGTTTSPNTFYSIKKADSLIVELKNEEDIIKMKSFSGSKNSMYQIYISNDGEKYHYVTKINGEGSFAWDEARILTKGKYLKFLFTEDSTLGELAFYNNKKEKIEIKSIFYKDNKIEELTDEETTIPKQISYYNSSYFDEIYFARTAYEYTQEIETYEWTHPPLGKLIQAIPIFLTKKMTPFNYRLMGNIAGILMLVVIYNFGKLLFKKRKYAILATLLLALDTFHFTQTRMGTVDSHLVLFIMLSVYYMCKFTTTSKTRDLLLSGIFFGLSISVKWTGLYAGLALCIIYFSFLISQKKLSLKYLLKGTVFFVVIPSIFYLSLYFIFPNNRIYYTNSLENTLKQQVAMYNYHSKLESDHYFSSSWYTWPIVYKPIWYHNQQIDNNNRETITAVGNIFIWWLGIISIIYLSVNIIKRKDRTSFLLLIVILGLWLPYALIGRVMFIYHYFPVTPFIILSNCLFLKNVEEKFNTKLIIPTYLLLVLLFFIIYYPVASGKIVNNNYIESLKLFKSWYF